jgi:branched-chain amino acid transport system ATP-binding protein
MSAMLETKGLVKRFGGDTVIDGLDLSVEAGEIRCVIGPNGAGKSTFLGLVIGAVAPTAGSIFFNGIDVSRMPAYRRIRNGLGIKFQVPGVFADLSVRDNLSVALQRSTSAGTLAGETDRLLAYLALHHHESTRAGDLSHGQQQWLEIGMALATQPRLLLLDEPTAGMSVEETARTGELVQRLNADGTTIIAIEHDMAFVRQVATKVTLLHYGRIFREGTIAEIENDDDVAQLYLGVE